jgi:hypothetical protein
MVHLLPVVLREIDDLKRGGKTQQLRDAAQRADRRLKGLRDNGDVLLGARIAGDVYAVFEHTEPRDDRLPSWLDLTVPDDRFTASSLLLQAEHPRLSPLRRHERHQPPDQAHRDRASRSSDCPRRPDIHQGDETVVGVQAHLTSTNLLVYRS